MGAGSGLPLKIDDVDKRKIIALPDRQYTLSTGGPIVSSLVQAMGKELVIIDLPGFELKEPLTEEKWLKEGIATKKLNMWLDPLLKPQAGKAYDIRLTPFNFYFVPSREEKCWKIRNENKLDLTKLIAKGVRYYVVPIVIYFPSAGDLKAYFREGQGAPAPAMDVGHQNILFFDLHAKTVEHFEPHGDYGSLMDFTVPICGWPVEMISHLAKYGKTKASRAVIDEVQKFVKTLDGGPYTVIPPNVVCPYPGPQRDDVPERVREKLPDSSGFCIAYADMYAHLRLLNPNLSPSLISNWISTGGRFGNRNWNRLSAEEKTEARWKYVQSYLNWGENLGQLVAKVPPPGPVGTFTQSTAQPYFQRHALPKPVSRREAHES